MKQEVKIANMEKAIERKARLDAESKNEIMLPNIQTKWAYLCIRKGWKFKKNLN